MSSFDAFLKIAGVEGESRQKGYEKQIEIEGFSWGVNNPTSHGGAGGQSAGKSMATGFSFTKKTDKGSAKFFEKCARGQNFPEVLCSIRKATGDGGQEAYLTYKFTEVFVESVNWSGGGGGEPMESISLAFNKVEIEYKVQDAKGKLSAGAQVAYDWATGK